VRKWTKFEVMDDSNATHHSKPRMNGHHRQNSDRERS
jgi:hypothetical protein